MGELLRKYWWLILLWFVPVIIVGVSCGNWEALAGVATWLLAGGVVAAIWQIRETRKSTNAQVAVSLFSKLRDKDVLDTFREIYELKPDDVKRLLTSTDKEDVELKHRIEGVLDKFELLGALVAQEIINEQIAIEAYGGPPILKCWHQLGENYIKKVRKQRGLFCKYVEDFAARTFEFQKDKSPENEWVCFRRGQRGKSTNLIKLWEDNPDLQPKRQE